MIPRFRAAVRQMLLSWDRYTLSQLNAPLTHEMIRGSR